MGGSLDAQQEGYIADREERFAVLGDAVAAALAEVAEPVVVDLGCGPGSLSARLARRLPTATLIGVDANPLLIGLARARYGGSARWELADLGEPDWADTLPDVIHAAVSSTALHWMPAEQLAGLYRVLAQRTAPGGVFANADHLGLADTGLAGTADAVASGRAARAGVADRESWVDWWQAALADPRLLSLGRAEAQHHHGGNRLTVTEHAELLRAAGYTCAAPVWQVGTDQVLVALR